MATYAAPVEAIGRDSQAAEAQSIERHLVIHLQGKTTYRVKRRSDVIRVISGCAWITFDSHDWFVSNGEEITLTPGMDDAVIASLRGSPLVFAIIG